MGCGASAHAESDPVLAIDFLSPQLAPHGVASSGLLAALRSPTIVKHDAMMDYVEGGSVQKEPGPAWEALRRRVQVMRANVGLTMARAEFDADAEAARTLSKFHHRDEWKIQRWRTHCEAHAPSSFHSTPLSPRLLPPLPAQAGAVSLPDCSTGGRKASISMSGSFSSALMAPFPAADF